MELINSPVSPYHRVTEDLWKDKTRDLLTAHPLGSDEVIEAVINSWEGILNIRIGIRGHQIGVNVFPSPQIMAFFLHELIPLELEHRHPGVWRRDSSSDEKDVVYIPNDYYSFEIKTSSSRTGIFGNRSYAQPSPATRKHKAGYYLAVNFEKFTGTTIMPKITRIRRGWLDHTDWIGQRAATGQQARLTISARDNKLIEIYRASE